MLKTRFKNRLILCLTAFMLTAPPVFANDILERVPSGSYPVDLSHASVVWKVSHFGLSTYVGRFTDFSADLTLDSADFTNSAVSVAIKTDSIDTAYPFADEKDFNKTLATDWFESAEYPLITFESTKVGPLVDGKSQVTGNLSMAGETHPVVLNVTLNNAIESHPINKVATIGFSATAEIDRSVWGVSNLVQAVSANVRIEIEGEFLKAE